MPNRLTTTKHRTQFSKISYFWTGASAGDWKGRALPTTAAGKVAPSQWLERLSDAIGNFDHFSPDQLA